MEGAGDAQTHLRRVGKGAAAGLIRHVPGMSWRVGVSIGYKCDRCGLRGRGERWHCARHYRDLCRGCAASSPGCLCQACGISSAALDARLSLQDFVAVLSRGGGGATEADVEVCFQRIVGADGLASVNDLVSFVCPGYPDGQKPPDWDDRIREQLRSASSTRASDIDFSPL